MSSTARFNIFLPAMGMKITPKNDYTKHNLVRRPDLITPGMSARRASDFSFLEIPDSAMPEVKHGVDQCFTCSMYGHVFVDCPIKGSKPREDFNDWRLVANGKVYSCLALWPHLAVQRAIAASPLFKVPVPPSAVSRSLSITATASYHHGTSLPSKRKLSPNAEQTYSVASAQPSSTAVNALCSPHDEGRQLICRPGQVGVPSQSNRGAGGNLHIRVPEMSEILRKNDRDGKFQPRRARSKSCSSMIRICMKPLPYNGISRHIKCKTCSLQCVGLDNCSIVLESLHDFARQKPNSFVANYAVQQRSCELLTDAELNAFRGYVAWACNTSTCLDVASRLKPLISFQPSSMGVSGERNVSPAESISLFVS
ncbi:uncharacterized protein MELLADRAFT_66712 [Melampsora larici-populina 98AG31]|uniref:CCHC-type domain-containing protein n=1 Tax=Melampsora larici-populina (strain 98AG31 / pathotype 3-4-7) TaxID=747676 RepID=F4S0A3_MELLP|nr:uncharacterized protein MELLADRAFT_66712 [Melampsora larici-populina 98AG31]EGG01974.1 hypothetical protein MELLADRAFT_66712 [Melampsora larici-populina 98AG31]